MQATLDRFGAVLRTAYPRLAAMDEAEASRRPEGMTWSRKEILGHLIDSAGNNHQRFVRSQLQTPISFPPYEQESWVERQGYGDRPWNDLVLLWRCYNQHLLHVMARVPAEKLGNECVVREDEPVTLVHHMTDYVRHLEHHLAQILG